MWYYLCTVMGVVIGFGTFALVAIISENKEIRRLRGWLEKIKDRKPLMAGENSAYFAGFGDALSYCKEDAEKALKGN